MKLQKLTPWKGHENHYRKKNQTYIVTDFKVNIFTARFPVFETFGWGGYLLQKKKTTL